MGFESLEGRTLLAGDLPNDLVVVVPPHAWEGQALTNGGAVQIGAALAEPLVVTLASSDTTELAVPATVTIPAGTTSATFALTLPADGLKDGAQATSLIASAAGSTNGTASVIVHDADLDHLAFDSVAGLKSAGEGFGVTARALNRDGEPIAGYNASASVTGAIGTLSSQTIFANSNYSGSGTNNLTWGYSFRPNTNVTITHLRTFFGSKVSIWNTAGNLVATQLVNATPGQWTETALQTPITLQANTVYRIGVFTNGGTYYVTSTKPTFAWGSILGALYGTGDIAPSVISASTGLVDLRISTGTSIPVNPAMLRRVSFVTCRARWRG